MKCKQFALLDVLLGDAKHLALGHYTWVKSRKWAVLPPTVSSAIGVMMPKAEFLAWGS